MSDSTVVLVTGASRGIGKALVEAYLSRPNHTVIGSVRSKTSAKAQELTKLPTAAGSRLLLVVIESTSQTDPLQAVKDIEAAGVDHLDVVVANAGIVNSEGIDGFIPLESVAISEVKETFEVNALGPLALFQAVRGLLQKSKSPVWLSVSTLAASVNLMEKSTAYLAPSYATSKVMLNWITMAAHYSNDWLIAFAVHPGFIRTDMGIPSAAHLGIPSEALRPPEESAQQLIKLIDGATRETTSGKFYNAQDGSVLPW